MERKTRIWIGLGAAVLVSTSAMTQSALALSQPVETGTAVKRTAAPQQVIRIAQSEESSFEGGEGATAEGGEGGGQVLGTIQEFRLGSTDPNAFTYDGSRQVEAYVAHVYDSYVAAHAAALAMQEAIVALLDTPSAETLNAARSAWLEARPAYMRTEAFLYYAGPVDIPGSPGKRLNAWPVDPQFIEGLIGDSSIAMNRATIVRMDQTADAAHVTTGWHAIEFLLWGEDTSATGPGARPHADFVAGTESTDRRREFLRIITQVLVNDLGTLVPAWAPDIPNNYRAAMVAMDQRNAIGRAFNGMAVLAGYEVALRRISASLFSSGTEHEHSRFSDSTTADVVNDLEGVRQVYFGTEPGSGFDALVGSIDPALNDRVVAAFARAESAVAALDVPYDTILASPSGSPARVEAQEASAVLKDLASLLRTAGNRLGVLVVIPGV